MNTLLLIASTVGEDRCKSKQRGGKSFVAQGNLLWSNNIESYILSSYWSDGLTASSDSPDKMLPLALPQIPHEQFSSSQERFRINHLEYSSCTLVLKLEDTMH